RAPEMHGPAAELLLIFREKVAISAPFIAEPVGRSGLITPGLVDHQRYLLSSRLSEGRDFRRRDGGLAGPARRDGEQHEKRPQFFTVVAPAGLVLVEQVLDRAPLKPVRDRIGARQQHVTAAFPEQGADQPADRDRKTVLLALDDRRRQIAAGD